MKVVQTVGEKSREFVNDIVKSCQTHQRNTTKKWHFMIRLAYSNENSTNSRLARLGSSTKSWNWSIHLLSLKGGRTGRRRRSPRTRCLYHTIRLVRLRWTNLKRVNLSHKYHAVVFNTQPWIWGQKNCALIMQVVHQHCENTIEKAERLHNIGYSDKIYRNYWFYPLFK